MIIFNHYPESLSIGLKTLWLFIPSFQVFRIRMAFPPEQFNIFFIPSEMSFFSASSAMRNSAESDKVYKV